jgi:putative ABC transport system permease protein
MARILNLFRGRRARLERDLDRELRYHVDRRVDDLVKNGLSETEARRRTSIEFGSVAQVQEEVRDTWTWAWLDAFVADVRYATRGLAKSWGFSLGTIAVLALGIGATVAIFSVVNTVLLRPLAYPDAERIVSIETFWTNTGRATPDVSGPDFLDWKAQNTVFEKMAVFYGNQDAVTIVNDRAVFANARYVSADFFLVFGQAPAAGRLLTERDVPAGEAEPTVAVVAHHWAVGHFGSASGAIGKTINVYGSPMEVVGVSLPGFRYPGASDIWVPSGTASGATNRSDHNYQAVAKLKADVDLARAQAAMRAVGDNLGRQYAENRHTTVAVTPLQDRLTGNVRAMLWVLMGAVFAVLLIACANISNLLLARAAVRMREFALRAALGAGRGRLVRQLLTESCVLGIFAGGAGVMLAFVLVPGLVAMSPAGLPRLDEVRIDTTALLFALALSLISTTLFGLVPAIHASRFDLSRLLKQGGSKGATSGRGPGPRAALVIAEVALSVMLLAAAGLLLQSFQALQRVNLGFRTDHVLVARTEYAVDTDEDIRKRSRYYAEVLDRLRAVPGVQAAAGTSFLPMGQEPREARDYFIQGQPDAQPGARPGVELYPITPDYFKTLEIPVRAGRDFARSDTPERPRVAIINEALARTAFPGVSPIGRFIRTNKNNNTPWMEIVGVVGDTRWQDPSSPPPLMLFVSSLQGWGKSLSILVRTSLDEKSLAPTIRAFLRDGNPNVPVRFDTMDQLFADAVASPRFRTQLIGAFAVIAALLAAVGIFSVLAYLVGQRTREIAVRRAVGAETRDVIRLIVGQGMRLVAVGLVVGLGGALAVARLLQGLLYEISPWDVGPYLGALGVIGVAAMFATLIPAIRAATIAPLVALQQE